MKHGSVDDIAFTDEIRDKGIFRFIINVYGRADLKNVPPVHDDDRIAHGQGFLLIVGHINKGNADLLLNLLELYLHFFSQLEIQSAQRFVQKQHLRAVDDGACDRNSLLLTTGQGSGTSFFKA